MTDEQTTGAHGGTEPLIVGITEGVNAGYQALEHVLEGLRESIRSRSGGATGKYEGGHSLDFDDIVRMASELLNDVGDLAKEVAKYVRSRAGDDDVTRPDKPDRLRLKAHAGKPSEGEFVIHNRGRAELKHVVPSATDLVMGERRIEAGVEFDPAGIETIPPNTQAKVRFRVELPDEVAEGEYYGLLHASPGGAVALIVLEVMPQADVEAEHVPADEPLPVGA